MAGERASMIDDHTTTMAGRNKQQEHVPDDRAGSGQRWDGGEQSGQVALEDGLDGTGVRERTMTTRTTSKEEDTSLSDEYGIIFR
jgi:hypothetical protein